MAQTLTHVKENIWTYIDVVITKICSLIQIIAYKEELIRGQNYW